MTLRRPLLTAASSPPVTSLEIVETETPNAIAAYVYDSIIGPSPPIVSVFVVVLAAISLPRLVSP